MHLSYVPVTVSLHYNGKTWRRLYCGGRDFQHQNEAIAGPIVSLRISMRESGEVTILDLCGRSTVNDGETELLSKRLEELVGGGTRYLLLNMSDLTQIDSSGVSVVVKAYARLRRQGGDLKLLRPRGHARSVLRVLHLLELIPSFEEEDQALRSFQQPVKLAKP